jgi:hypothetical protein
LICCHAGKSSAICDWELGLHLFETQANEFEPIAKHLAKTNQDESWQTCLHAKLPLASLKTVGDY